MVVGDEKEDGVIDDGNEEDDDNSFNSTLGSSTLGLLFELVSGEEEVDTEASVQGVRDDTAASTTVSSRAVDETSFDDIQSRRTVEEIVAEVMVVISGAPAVEEVVVQEPLDSAVLTILTFLGAFFP